MHIVSECLPFDGRGGVNRKMMGMARALGNVLVCCVLGFRSSGGLWFGSPLASLILILQGILLRSPPAPHENLVGKLYKKKYQTKAPTTTQTNQFPP